MAAQDGAHRDLSIVRRCRLECSRELIAPFQKFGVKILGLLPQVLYFLRFKVLSETVYPVYLSAHSTRNPVQIAQGDESDHQGWLRLLYDRTGEEFGQLFVIKLEGILCVAIRILDAEWSPKRHGQHAIQGVNAPEDFAPYVFFERSHIYYVPSRSL